MRKIIFIGLILLASVKTAVMAQQVSEKKSSCLRLSLRSDERLSVILARS